MQSITTRNLSIEDNATLFLDTLRNDVAAKIDELRLAFPDTDVDEAKRTFQSLGITNANTYLYVRGHNIFSLCCLIGKKVCERMLQNKKEELGEDREAIRLLYEGKQPFAKQILSNRLIDVYPEIQKIGADMRVFQSLPV